jgi:hypothetical protein
MASVSYGGAMNAVPMLAPDAAMALGIAATAIPFARTPEDQAERWLRVLRLHGEVGSALQALGVSEVPLIEEREAPEGGSAGERASAAVEPDGRDVIARVSEYAGRIALEREEAGIGTTDVLLAVMQVYGAVFERALRAHGTDGDEVLARLGVEWPEPPDS